MPSAKLTGNSPQQYYALNHMNYMPYILSEFKQV